jgi:hypothetical protein
MEMGMTFRQHIYKAWEVDIYGNFNDFSQRQKEAFMSAKDVEFDKFKTDVDRLLVKMVGLTSDDLTDATWYDYFDSELSPVDTILCAVDDAWYDEPDLQDLIIAQVEKGKI